MNLFVVVLSCLFFCRTCTTQRTSVAEDSEIDLEFENVFSEESFLEDSAIASISAPEVEDGPLAKCSEVIFRAWLCVGDGIRLHNLTTNSIFECCEACDGVERCTTWRRNRNDGWCELFETKNATYQIHSFYDSDVGGFVGQRLPVQSTSPETAPDLQTEFLAETAALRIAAPSKCRVRRETTYPRGIVLARGTILSSNYCCEICRSSRSCNSWYFNKRSNRCILNRNVPKARKRESFQFAGGTVAD